MKIFISYNHKDQATALKIRDCLSANGFEVIIDQDKMRTGQDIEQFILNCIRESGVTLSLISSNSLMSAWVAMETITSQVDEQIRGRYFVPCYIDKEFFDRNFTASVLEKIDGELNEIALLMKTALDKGWGIEDLQSERTRYNKLKVNLPEIIGKLRNSLCIDLSPEHFDQGMQKIITDLKNYDNAKEPSPIQDPSPELISDLPNMIHHTFDDFTKRRFEDLSGRLAKHQELLDRYEQELDLADDPRRQMRLEREIENTKRSMQKIVDEIKSL